MRLFRYWKRVFEHWIRVVLNRNQIIRRRNKKQCLVYTMKVVKYYWILFTSACGWENSDLGYIQCGHNMCFLYICWFDINYINLFIRYIQKTEHQLKYWFIIKNKNSSPSRCNVWHSILIATPQVSSHSGYQAINSLLGILWLSTLFYTRAVAYCCKGWTSSGNVGPLLECCNLIISFITSLFSV